MMAEGLRVVTFNVFPPAYELVAEWAKRHGHRLVLLVTSPSREGARYGAAHRGLVAAVPPEQDVLITTRLQRTAAPAIAALAPDLIVSATFPHRIPREVIAIPRYGAVNLHPAPLPRGRGPNPMRMVYEGDLSVGAVLHRLEHEFDAGAILSRRAGTLPAAVTAEAIYGTWLELLMEVLEEGTARAVAGEPGEPQDEALATYAAPFTEEERWLTWDEPALAIQRRAAALNLLVPSARAWIDGQAFVLADVRARADEAPATTPGTVLDRVGEVLVVAVADGAVEVTARPS